MGYAQSGLRKNAKLVTPQFLSINKDGNYSLDDLKPSGAKIIDNIEIQTLNAYGQTVDSYFWADGGDLRVEEDDPCWTDEDYTAKVTGVSFAPGAGLWIYATSTDQSMTSSGQVGTDDVVVQLRKNATACGNPFPIKLALQDIVPTGTKVIDNVEIQTLNAYGQTVDSYFWADGGDLRVEEDDPCWTDEDYTAKVTGVEFDPGEGLWIYGSSDQQYVTFPAPEL